MRMSETHLGKFFLEHRSELDWSRYENDVAMSKLKQYVNDDLLLSVEEAHVFNDVRLIPMFGTLFKIGEYAGLGGWFSGYVGYDISWAKKTAYAVAVKCFNRDVADSAVYQLRLLLRDVSNVCMARSREVIIFVQSQTNYDRVLSLLDGMDMTKFMWYTAARRVEIKPLGVRARPALDFAACMPSAEGIEELVERLPDVFTTTDDASKIKLVESATNKLLVGSYFSDDGVVSDMRCRSRARIMRNGQYVKFAPTKAARNYNLFVDLLIWKAIKVEDLADTLLPKNPIVVWMMKAMSEYSEL